MLSGVSSPVAVHDMPAWIDDVLHVVDAARRAVRHVRHDVAHSNDIYELVCSDERVLLVKRARHEWARESFAVSAAAAQIIAHESDLVVPQPLEPAATMQLGVQVYWRVPLPTLAQLWPTLSAPARQSALRSCGALLRRLHAIRVAGYGPVSQLPDGGTLQDQLYGELWVRLLPAVYAHWPAGLRHLDRLIELIPGIQQLGGHRAPALVHTDFHFGNVLCRVTGERVECVGLLDLDGVAGGAPECDLAGFDVLHGRIFCQYIPYAMRHQVRRTYGTGPDQRVFEFFRCHHLVNQGFNSAFLGHEEHAAEIASELYRQMRSLERKLGTRPPAPVIAVAAIRS